MTRGQVIEMDICDRCLGASMRVWPVKLKGKDIAMCKMCIGKAAERGGYIEATEMGKDTVYLSGPDISVQ